MMAVGGGGKGLWKKKRVRKKERKMNERMGELVHHDISRNTNLTTPHEFSKLVSVTGEAQQQAKVSEKTKQQKQKIKKRSRYFIHIAYISIPTPQNPFPEMESIVKQIISSLRATCIHPYVRSTDRIPMSVGMHGWMVD